MSLRFGLVGLGYHGFHAVLPSFEKSVKDGAVLTAVCDVSQASLDMAPAHLKKYRSAEEMIHDGPVDAVYVAVGRDFSGAIVKAALNAGKEVICEKPMAKDIAEAQEIADTVARTGRTFAVNFETRYGQRMRILKRWIEEGRFGEIHSIQFDNQWDCHKSFTDTAPRRARLLSLSGALDCGIHELDQARYLLGGDWSVVQALGAWFGEEFVPPPHISVTGLLGRKTLVSLNASLAFTANIEPRRFLDNLYLAGTEGVAVVTGGFLCGPSEAELVSRTLCTKIPFTVGGHDSDIVPLLKEVVLVAENGPQTPHLFAGAHDGFQAQYAMETAIASAVAERNRQAESQLR